MPTVALHGHNGNVGSATLSHLIKAHRSGKIKLVMLHRASSDLSTVPSDVEKRVIDLESGDLATNQKAVAGLNIVMYVRSFRIEH